MSRESGTRSDWGNLACRYDFRYQARLQLPAPGYSTTRDTYSTTGVVRYLVLAALMLTRRVSS